MAEAIQKFQLDTVDWLQLIVDVCDAVKFGHGKGVVHRDITPRNIMLTRDQKPKAILLDFGIAKRTNQQATRSLVRGTERYLAPEQLQGKFDERTDQFGLGMVLRDVMVAKYGSRDRIPQSIAGIIDQATAQNPDDRYQTADRMHQALNSVIQGVESGVEDISPNNKRVGSKKKATGWVRIGVLAATLLIIGFVSTHNRPTVNKPRQAPIPSHPPVYRSDTPSYTTLASSQYFAGELAKIQLDSEPSGAELTFFPLTDGEPELENVIEAGVAPLACTFTPGDYLVRAGWSDGSYTEVLRRVPAEGALVTNLHFASFELGPERLRLATVNKPQPIDHGLMIEEDGFWIDAHSSSLSDLSAGVITNTFGVVVDRLEIQGKRPPFESELEKARTTSGLRVTDCEWTCSLVAHVTHPNQPSSLKYSLLRVAYEKGENKNVAGYHRSITRFRGVRSRLDSKLGQD